MGSPLAPSARRVSRVASRLPGTTRLRFALHGGQRLWERIGRLKETSRGVGQHYEIELIPDAKGEKAVELRYRRKPVNGGSMSHPGVYCLRSSETDWDEETLWRTYITLTDLEAVFRSLKSELGLRPVYHHKEARADGLPIPTIVTADSTDRDRCTHRVPTGVVFLR